VVPEAAHQLEHLAQALFVANVVTDEVRGAHDVTILSLPESPCYFNQRDVMRLPTSVTLDAEVAHIEESNIGRLRQVRLSVPRGWRARFAVSLGLAEL